jgi:hypothetical protein
MTSAAPTGNGIFSVPAAAATPVPTPTQPAAVAVPVAAAAATSMQIDEAPVSVNRTATVDEPMSMPSLEGNPDKMAIIAAFKLRVEKQEREAAELRAQNALLQQRDAERSAAEQARRDSEAAALEQQRREKISDTRQKLEAVLQAALQTAKQNDPENFTDDDIRQQMSDFQADLESAGLDESQIKRVADKVERNVGYVVRASQSAARTRAELERRELESAVRFLAPQPTTSFSISGGLSSMAASQQSHHQQPPPPSSSMFASSAASSSSSGFGQPALFAPPAPLTARQPEPVYDSGTVSASKSTGIFSGLLGKRSVADVSPGDVDFKRAVVSESAVLPPNTQSTPNDIDFTKEDCWQQVIVASVMAGEGVPTESVLRRGGFATVQKYSASATGGTIVTKSREPRLAAPFPGPFTMKHLDPKGFKYCVDGLKHAFGKNGSRPQVGTLNEAMALSALLGTQYRNNQHMMMFM